MIYENSCWRLIQFIHIAYLGLSRVFDKRKSKLFSMLISEELRLSDRLSGNTCKTDCTKFFIFIIFFYNLLFHIITAAFKKCNPDKTVKHKRVFKIQIYTNIISARMKKL